MNQVFTDPTGQVSARIIAHTKSAVTGIEMKTFEWEFPRIILAEVNTHKALNKNASSSRAIPVKTLLDQVRNNPAMPVRFGAANSGMQDKGVHNELVKVPFGDCGEFEYLSPQEAWSLCASDAASLSEAFAEAGYAKQICNRLTEPFQRMKQVVSGTDFENFFWLRDHGMADPTIDALAKCAKQALEASTPVILKPGEWHVPYYNEGVWIPHKEAFGGGVIVDKFGHSLEHALVISASCCAQVSYRKLDDTIEKAKGVVARLNLHGEEPNDPVHASPLEHQGTPVAKTEIYENAEYDLNSGHPGTWQEGVTHMRRDGTLCSGNLRGYIQHRQLVPNHVREG